MHGWRSCVVVYGLRERLVRVFCVVMCLARLHAPDGGGSMATVEKPSGSILSSLAGHERSLLGRIEAAKNEAREIIESARTDARKHVMVEETRLFEDLAKSRSDAQAAREKTFHATLDGAEQGLASVRQEALRRAPDTAKKVLDLFLPGGVQGPPQ